MSKNNLYFVYCFFDPRRPGKYSYRDFYFEFEPIYIGKGKGKRPQKHYTLYKLINNRFYSKIESIIKSGMKPNFSILIDNLNELDALRLEIEYIKIIGRIENGGSLTNLTDGGKGNSGFHHSDITKKRMSEKRKGRKIGPMSEEQKLYLSIIKTGTRYPNHKPYTYTVESKNRMIEKGKLRIGDKNPMYKRKHKESSKELMGKNRNKKFGKDNPAFGKEKKQEDIRVDAWKLTDKDGNVIIINNLRKFCRENGLTISCMQDLYNKRSKTHKEWRCVEKLTNTKGHSKKQKNLTDDEIKNLNSKSITNVA